MAPSTYAAPIVNRGLARAIFRSIHIVFSIPILGYIYSPFEQIPNYAPLVRFLFLPVLVLSGLWMWKGHLLRRRIARQPAGSSGSPEKQ